MSQFQKLVVGAVLSVVSLAANAGVVYRWENLSTVSNFGPATGVLEIAYDKWQFGATASLTNQTGNVTPDLSPPFGVESFVFFGRPSVGEPTTRVNLQFSPCYTFHYCTTDDPVTIGQWGFDITFGSVLTGSIAANDTNSSVRMSSSNSVWTIQDFSTDGPPAACFSHLCGGGTGKWVLDQSTVAVASAVPEGEAWAMAALGLIGVVAARWRRRSYSTTSLILA